MIIKYAHNHINNICIVKLQMEDLEARFLRLRSRREVLDQKITAKSKTSAGFSALREEKLRKTVISVICISKNNNPSIWLTKCCDETDQCCRSPKLRSAAAQYGDSS